MKKDKAKNKKVETPSFFKELGCFMKPYKVKYFISIVLSILSVGANMATYGLAGLVTYKIFDGSRDFFEFLPFVIGIVACKILNIGLMNLSTWISHRSAYFTLQDIRIALADKMLKLPLGYFEKKGSGRLKTLLVDRIETMERTLAHLLPELTADILAPLAIVVWMFVIDYRLALIAICWMILGFSVTGGMMKNYEEKFQGQIKASKTMNQSVVEYVNGIEVIKNFGRTKDCYEKYKRDVENHAKYNVNWQKETQVFSALGMAVAPFSVLPVLIFGLVFYGKGTLTCADFVLMVMLCFAFFAPLMNSMGFFDQLASMGTDAKEIKEILEYRELERGEANSFKDASIKFENVGFSYDGKKQVLKDISFNVGEGEVIALVGPSGSGKSTVAKILSGYYDANQGQIFVGERNIKEYSIEALNSQIAYVDQETFLFDGTVLDNIKMAKPDASDEEVISVAKSAGCDEFISNLQDGYQTQTGACGNKLSGGEKQRIAIARAMLKDAPIIVLDEATSGSDPENEATIQDALSSACVGKTLLVVAHRLRTVENADKILYIEDGEIKAEGRHEELLKNFTPYKTAWELGEEKSNA